MTLASYGHLLVAIGFLWVAQDFDPKNWLGAALRVVAILVAFHAGKVAARLEMK